MKKITLLIIAILLANTLYSQEFKHKDLLSFEKLNKEEWTLSKGQKISNSLLIYKHGIKSLKWDWKQSGSITLNKNIGFVPFNPEGESKAIPSFCVWIYNEKPIKDSLTFVFGTDKTDNCYFPFYLNFKGWRGAWVSFERDMKGKPVKTMNRLTIKSPLQQEKSWNNKPYITIKNSVSKDEKKAFDLITKRFEKNLLKKQNVTEKIVDDLQKKYDFYEIFTSGKSTSGKPLWFIRNAELYQPWAGHKIGVLYKGTEVSFKYYFSLMDKIAQAYRNCNDIQLKDKLGNMFLNMFNHMQEQGAAFGSCLGTIHHYGYNWRNYYTSLFLMRDFLKKNNKLDDAINGMQWYSTIGELCIKPKIKGIDMDAFNTMVNGRLASILIMPDSPKKSQYLSMFSNWITNGLLPAPGLNDAFKIDGSSYHHANNYPAYAIGGMKGATKMVFYLHNTPFKVSREAHSNLKKALLTMRFYCNLQQWPLSMSGRHPHGKGKLQPNDFAVMANSGTPEGDEEIDSEMAAAYMRLVQNKSKDKKAAKYNKLGIKSESAPQGFLMLPYASVATLRHNEWAATVRGHSRYLWAAEHYIGHNLFGRYLAHGSLQIMAKGNPINNKKSGFSENGWDWNHIPGTTATNISLDSLKANVLNVDQFSGYEEMLFSDESFAGGLSNRDDKNGVYAFILHEHDKYNGSLRARKSWFFLGNKIVCLGSGIFNADNLNETHTTVFQNNILKNDNSVSIKGTIQDKNIKKEFKIINNWIIDNKNNAYFFPNANIIFSRGVQESRLSTTGEPTKGKFCTAYLSHGVSPSNAGYQYCIFPDVTPKDLSEAKQNIGYSVLVKNNDSHIVKNTNTHNIYYVFFNKADNNAAGDIINTNMPCIAITNNTDNILKLSVVNPDLALYSGKADEIYKNGKRVERSIYSRPWRSSLSQETLVEIEVKGIWNSKNKNIIIEHNDKNTIIKLKCKDGLPTRIELIK